MQTGRSVGWGEAWRVFSKKLWASDAVGRMSRSAVETIVNEPSYYAMDLQGPGVPIAWSDGLDLQGLLKIATLRWTDLAFWPKF
jgi:hypothetical protein